MSTPSVDFLATNSFPELASAVRAVIAVTIVRWEQAVRDVLPNAHQLTLVQLRDDMPVSLAVVADAVGSTQRFSAERLVKVTPVHGGVRYEQGFALDEVLVEYSLLRAALISEVTAYLKRDLHAGEALALGAAMDISVREAVVRFVEHLTRQLQNATEAQSKYLSFLSHDLRGGLNGVFLMIEVLKRELANEARLAETVSDLDVMRRSLLETVGTMDRFLHAERFRKGKIQVRPVRLNLHDLLSETIAHFSYQSKDQGIALRLEATGECVITSDKEMLTLIFQNLVSNAVKYGGKGKPVLVTVQTEQSGCTITVRDQGPGIEPSRLTTLFEPFERGETHGQPGVGLGLSIARQAAQYIGARLWAESTPGHGATFFVKLPGELNVEGQHAKA